MIRKIINLVSQNASNSTRNNLFAEEAERSLRDIMLNTYIKKSFNSLNTFKNSQTEVLENNLNSETIETIKPNQLISEVLTDALKREAIPELNNLSIINQLREKNM